MNAFQKLVEHSNKVSNFRHLSSIVGWDQAAVMPSGGAEARSNAMAELEVHIHSLMTQPHLGDLFAQAEAQTLS
ncbi:carboxypeptidase M32, partial [Vibrio astriarenae]